MLVLAWILALIGCRLEPPSWPTSMTAIQISSSSPHGSLTKAVRHAFHRQGLLIKSSLWQIDILAANFSSHYLHPDDNRSQHIDVSTYTVTFDVRHPHCKIPSQTRQRQRFQTVHHNAQLALLAVRHHLKQQLEAALANDIARTTQYLIAQYCHEN